MDYQDITLTKSAGHERAICPMCSGTRRKSGEKCLSVDIEEKIYYCHHCGWSGGHKEAKIYFKPFFELPESGLPENVVKYFSEIGITEAVLSENKIGYGKSFKDANAIQYPYYKNGEVVNIKHRTSDKRFRQEKDAEKCFYRFEAMVSGEGTLIITEGENDTLAINTCGYDNVVSIPDGAPSAEAKQYATKFDFLKSAEKHLEKYDKIILAMDDDAPGKVASKELSRRIGHEKSFTVQYPENCKDACDVLKNHGIAELQRVILQAKPWPICGVFKPTDYTRQLEDEYKNGIKGGESTGWNSLDDFYTVRPGELTIVTGIPSHGKSNFIDALMINLIGLKGWRFGIFSPENWPVQRHLRTLIEKFIEKPFAENREGVDRITLDEIDKAQKMLDNCFRFIAPENEILSIELILKKAKQLLLQFGINGLVIDPWNEVEHMFGSLREDQYISQKLSALRIFARINNIHIWVVAHPRLLKKNDKGGYDPPTPYDISGGAQWRNKADNAICVYRDDFDSKETEICIQKIRYKEIGKVGKSVLTYNTVSGGYY